ncbi:hypothetical protein CDL15_Pgr008795 [Punica granatum]|uniref:S-protein homolog n=1 Tax=Punica granatum TaxID=22663 RepID=A0A218VXR5_PUNGR|nr:hypothetical protein CDL15_Pgr008795 [Punica granatum]PKI31166.1 hypothetical protein CRG98_048443 [Punica granatum]
MGSSPKHLIVLMAVALSVLMDHTCEGQHHEPPDIITPGPVHITIENDLANSATLTVHCRRIDRDSEEDYGTHDVAPRSTYEFGFMTLEIPVAAANCSFQWPPQNFHDLKVFSQGRDGNSGDHLWMITEGGACRDTGYPAEYCHGWTS